LKEKFPNAWIGKGGPIFWPTRSPDLTPMEIFLWGYVRNIMYGEKIRDRITTDIATVTPDVIQRTGTRFNINEAHIEIH
jgi:hypothetical protein